MSTYHKKCLILQPQVFTLVLPRRVETNRQEVSSQKCSFSLLEGPGDLTKNEYEP